MNTFFFQSSRCNVFSKSICRFLSPSNVRTNNRSLNYFFKLSSYWMVDCNYCWLAISIRAGTIYCMYCHWMVFHCGVCDPRWAVDEVRRSKKGGAAPRRSHFYVSFICLLQGVCSRKATETCSSYLRPF